MFNQYCLFTFVLSFLFTNLYSQPSEKFQKNNSGGKISGIVIDYDSSEPLEYANLVLLTSNDTTQISGTITDSDGYFEINQIKPDKYFLKISYIGYNPVYIDDVLINNENKIIELEDILLKEAIYQLNSAEVIANKTPVEYHIDKKVINVSEQTTAISGSAVEVLENVPSVNVDIEGNVSLRGSESFTLLIDGRPTIMEATDLLQQIPASTIENIEIVTNPSAKYDPEGVSGIINIITKKNELVGINGVINTHVGLDNKYGADFIANYRLNGHTFYIGADYKNDKYPGNGIENRITYNDELESFLNSSNTRIYNRSGYNINGGADFTLDRNNQIGFSFRYGNHNFTSEKIVDFYEYTNPATFEKRYKNLNNSERGGDRFSSNLNYKHNFGKKNHTLETSIDFQKRIGEEFAINKYYDNNGIIDNGRKNTEDGPSQRIRIKADYSYPINNFNLFEAGFQSDLGKSVDDTKSFILADNGNDYIVEEEYSYLVDYKRHVHALYSIYKSEIAKFGYQVGLRGEYTDREISIPDSNSSSIINRWDYFPTIHTSYKFTELVQLMASYTRRIQRPRGYYFEPFLTWQDANNVRTGNPNLEPEYINSFEIAYQTHIDEVILSLESYYRIRENKIERVTAVYDTNVTLTSFENVGTDYTLGLEFMLDADLFSFWNLNFMGDLADYNLEGVYEGRDYSRDNFNWSLRLNNSFTITPTTKLQVNGMYRGPSISAQSEYEAYYSTNVAVKQDLFNKKLALTLQIRDIFQSSKREGTTNGAGFSNYVYSQMKTPIVRLNMTLNLNNYKSKNRKNNPNGINDNEGEEEM